MSTPIKGSFLLDLASLLRVPQPQRTELLRVVSSSPRGAKKGPHVPGPWDPLDSLMGLLWPPRSEPRPTWTHPHASPVKVSRRTRTPLRDGPCCQGYNCGQPHALDALGQGGMPTSHRRDSPGGPASSAPGSETRHMELRGTPSPGAVGLRVTHSHSRAVS